MKEMINDEDFKLLKIQTCVLRVNIHCDGCKQKVKKLLQRIEGVYQVNIDVEQQKVTVSGGIDAATLIKKLVKAGKHAELWSQKGSQNNNQKQQKGNCIKDDKNNSKCQKQQGLIKGLKKQQNFQFNLQDDENFLDDDEEEECDEEAEMRLVIEKANQISLLRQQAAAIEGNKKNFAAMEAAQNNANSGKKGNHQSGIDQKTMVALKMNNNVGGETKMGGNDINAMMNNLVGFYGNGANNNLAAMLGGNHQVQATNNNGFMGGFPTTMASTGNHPHNHPSSIMANMNYQQYPSSMLMNLQQQQPQMMYNRSAFVPSSTGYYYNYAAAPYPYNTYTTADHSDVFSDYNTNSCSIM